MEAWLAWWRGLAPRERLALALGGAAAGLLLLYALLWAPLQERLAGLRARLAEEEAQVAWMRRASWAAAPRRAPVSGSLLALVDRTARAAGLALARVQPEGEGRVRVRLEGAPFDGLARWLGELAAAGLRVEELEVERDRRAGPGRVRARLRLAREGAA